MGIQDAAARNLAEALTKRHMTTGMASAMNPSVWVTDHPNAVVHFKVDQLGGLVAEFVFDGRPPVRLDYEGAGVDAIADYVVAQIAGRGGRSSD